MKVFSFIAPGKDGRPYGVRLLATPEEIKGWQDAGLIPDVAEVIGMQTVADQVVAGFEREALKAMGGLIQ